MDSDTRKIFLEETKQRMNPFDWGVLVGHVQASSQEDPRYIPAYLDIEYINTFK